MTPVRPEIKLKVALNFPHETTPSIVFIVLGGNDTLDDLIRKISERAKISQKSLSFVYQSGIYIMQNGCQLHGIRSSLSNFMDSKGNKLPVEDAFVLTQSPVISVDDIQFLAGKRSMIEIDVNAVYIECGTSKNQPYMPVKDGYRALHSDAFVAWVECLRITDKSGKLEAKTFAATSEGGYVDIDNGLFFLSRVTLHRSLNFPPHSRREQMLYILFRESSVLPKWKIPILVYLIIYTKEGVDVCLHKGVIRATNQEMGNRRWISPAHVISPLQHAFTDYLHTKQ